MPKPYSLDLRERVVGFVEAGQSRHAAAAHFKVSVSFVVNLMKAVRMRGSFVPKPSGGRGHAKLEPHRSFLLAQVVEKADITMPELAAELAAATGELSRLDPGHVSGRSWLALLYLIGPGSLLAMTCYVIALRNLPTATVSTYAYVNPVVAVALGWLLLGERLTLVAMLGGAVVLVSVVLLLTSRSRGAA